MNNTQLEVYTFDKFRLFLKKNEHGDLRTCNFRTHFRVLNLFCIFIFVLDTQVLIFRLPKLLLKLWYCSVSVDQRKTRTNLFRS
jgi:hypothetical protein